MRRLSIWDVGEWVAWAALPPGILGLIILAQGGC